MANEVVARVLHAFVNMSVRLLVGLPGRAKQLILLGTVALTRFSAIVAHFGRFLPRLGPFARRTAFFYGAPQNPPKSKNRRFYSTLVLNGRGSATQICAPVLTALHRMQLQMMHCSYNWCIAAFASLLALP